MDDVIKKLIHSKREGTNADHILNAIKWRDYGHEELLHSPLAYSAIEFRAAIERYYLELYVMMRSNDLLDEELEEKELKNFKKIKSQIYEKAGNAKRLRRHFLFNRIYVQKVMGIGVQISIPDLGKLFNFWSDLSEYCHMQINPKSTWLNKEWIKSGYQLLFDIDIYFREILSEKRTGELDLKSINKNFLDARNDFIQEKIEMPGLIFRLQIIKNYLEDRHKRFKI